LARPLWRNLPRVAADSPASPCSAAAVSAFARLAGPGTAAWLGGCPSDDRNAALVRRFRRLNAVRLVGDAVAAGFHPLALKGLAAAHTLYPDPDLRLMADTDLLLPAGEVLPFIGWLHGRGYVFAAPSARSPWGWIGMASLRALNAPDGSVTVDLHEAGDAWPLPRALPADNLRAAMRTAATEAGPLPVPAPEHLLALAASHAARDLFAPNTARNLIDGALLLAGRAGPVDARKVAETLASAGLGRAFATFCGLIAELTEADWGLPPALRPAVGGLAAAFAAGDDQPPGWGVKLAREWGPAGGPGIALARNLRRLAGLLGPSRNGLPAGYNAGRVSDSGSGG
jgi:hypothetical protein